MTLFQLLGVGGALIVALSISRAIVRKRLAPGPGAIWVALWLAASLFIARPEWTVAVARRLGIARGADLVFYCAILAGMVGFLLIYLRMRRLDAQLTVLVREIALTRGELEEKERRSEPG